jgi:uncharacterized repeat protein (TIGR02543 family)/LPXTG-motif cell wall-anchored protein
VLCIAPMTALAEGASTKPAESNGESSPLEESVEEKTGTAVVQALIDALPDAESIDESNMEDVMNQLEAIDDAKFLLSEEETAALDFKRYDAAVAVLTGNGAGLTSTPMLTNTEVTSVSTEQQLEEAVNKGGSIQLTADITLTKDIDIKKTVALDLRGYTITSRAGSDNSIDINKSESLTISDSRTAGGGKIYCSIYLYDSGILQITGGTVSTISVRDGGVTLSAGTISTLYMSENSTFTMTGGVVSSEIHMSGNSTFTMTGGIVGRNLYMSKDSTFNAGGGTVQGYYVRNYGIIQGYSNGTTTFKCEVENHRTISGGIFYKEVTNKGTISGGIFYKGIRNNGTIASSAYVTVNFIDSSGTIGTQQVLRGQTATQPTKTGYTATYYTDSGCAEAFDVSSAITTSASTLNIYVKWTEKSNYTVKYNSNGGSAIADKTSVKWTDKVLNGVTSPTKNGYEFAGWTYSADGATTVDVDETTTYAGLAEEDAVMSVTLTAQWTDIVDPVISGIEDGKTYCEAQTVTVTDENIDTVTVNGNAVILDENNQFVLSPAKGEQTIIATDKDGNEATMTVTVNDGHTPGDWITDKSATATETGSRHKECTVCGKVLEKEAIAKLVPADNTKSPQTGDNSNIFLWLALLLVSGGAVTVTAFVRKKRRAE